MTIQKLQRFVEYINLAWMGIFVLLPPVLSAFLTGKGFGFRPGALGPYLRAVVAVQFAIAIVWGVLYVLGLRHRTSWSGENPRI